MQMLKARFYRDFTSVKVVNFHWGVIFLFTALRKAEI